jgi:hypothetical protein
VGTTAPGTVALPSNALFRIEPSLPKVGDVPPEKATGVLLGYFNQPNQDNPTDFVVVNLDYSSGLAIRLVGPSKLSSFDAKCGSWSEPKSTWIDLQLPPGGGKLIRATK